MKTKVSSLLTVIAVAIASVSIVRAGVTVTSPNFTFTGNWPENQPVAAGSYVPSSPANIAASAVGATSFAIGEYGAGVHTIAGLNDSRYGNSYSWITTSLTLSRSVNLGGSYGTVNMSFAGVAFSNATLHSISDIVFGRSAANEYQDRFVGNIYIQITTANSVAAITDLSATADAQWTTMGYFTTTDPLDHMFTFSTPVNATGVRIVTTAGNCIDEIVVHEAPPTEIVYKTPAFIWTNSVGAAWSGGANWTNVTSPNSILDHVYMVEAPESSKTIDVDTSYGLLDGKGYRYGTLTVDSTIGDGLPLAFTGDAFCLLLSDIDVTGTLILSNAVDSYAGLRITGGGETIMTEWTPTLVTLPKITIDEGSQLTVAGTVSTAENTLPANPWMHLDASQTNSMTLTDAGNDTYYVQQWNDVNGNGTYAYAEDAVNRPIWQIENGRANIDFGFLTFGYTGGIMNGKTLTWSSPDTGIRAVFLVYSDKPDDPYVQNIIGTKSVTPTVNFCRDGVIFNKTVASPSVTGGTITLDGLHVDGTDKSGDFNAYLSSGFHVIGITTTNDVSADCFARDHLQHAGGQKLAEVLIYNRELTLSEHKTVVAHLMNKWFENPLPTDSGAGSGQSSTLTLNNGATLKASSGFRTEDLTINGTVTKSGSEPLSAARITQIEGAFTLDSGILALTSEMFSESEYITGTPAPWIHLDASDYANSMQTSTDGNGNISVTSWSDINTNGFTASAPGYSTPPTLVTNGLNGLSFVDFGDLLIGETNGSHLIWNTTNGAMRTVVMVYSDSTNYLYSSGSDKRPCFLGRLYSNMQFWRGLEGSLIHRQAAFSAVKYGHMAVDGRAATPDTYLPVGFHVLSFVTTDNARSEVFARDMAGWTGGNRLAEVMIWNQPLTSPQLRSIEQELMVKWLALNRPGYPARLQEGPAAGAWMHVDASDTNSMELVEDSGNLYVQQWNDIRSNGIYAYAGESSYRPTWHEGDGFPYVDFGVLSGPGTGTPYGQHLFWSETNSSVRAVFLVYSDADSGLAQNFIGHLSGNLPFNRGLNHTFFHPQQASTYVLNGTHSLDYALLDGSSTPLPDGFHVIGIATQRGRPVEADVFARDREQHAGGQKLAEVLVYNRELSDAEFRQTRRYLMRKWFGTDSQQESELHHLIGATDATLDIGGGQTLTCQSAECPGTLEKRGAGRLIIGSGSAESISVPDGELCLNEQFTNIGGGTLSNLVMGSGATVNLNGNTFQVQAITGSGSLSNGTVTTSVITPGAEEGSPETLNLTGDLVLSSPCVINVDAAAEAMDKIDVSGNLTLSAEGTVIVSIPQGTKLPLSHQLFTFNTLTGGENLADWTVEVTQSNTYTAKLVQNANSIDLNFYMSGTILIIR